MMMDILKEFATKKLSLLKLDASEKGSLAIGTLVLITIISIALLFFIVLLNIGLALLIGNYYDNYAWGFLIMAGIYLFIIILVLLFRKSIIDGVANKIIKKLNL